MSVETPEMIELRQRIAAYREEKRLRRGTRKVFVEPTPDDFAEGCVLAFDQTLTKTGWAVVQVIAGTGLPPIAVSRGGMLKPQIDPDLRSFEQTFAKEAALDLLLAHLFESIETQRKHGHPRPEAVVHEMPSVQGHRLESSLMAAAAVRRQACRYGYPIVMLGRQMAYSRLVGHSFLEKSHGTATVNRLIPNYMRATEHWNQDVHDAVLLGLAYLHEKKRAAGE